MSTSIELLKEAALELTRLQMKCDNTGSANPIIDKLHHHLSTNGWLPIESAPKDGTRILILCPHNRIACAKYDLLSMVGKGWFVSVPCCSGWGEGSDTYIHWKEDQPTHWQPLPATTHKINYDSACTTIKSRGIDRGTTEGEQHGT